MPKELYIKKGEIYCAHRACDNVMSRLTYLLECTQNSAIVQQNKSLFLAEFKRFKGKKSNYDIKHLCKECK
jgi:hypothetical protein